MQGRDLCCPWDPSLAVLPVLKIAEDFLPEQTKQGDRRQVGAAHELLSPLHSCLGSSRAMTDAKLHPPSHTHPGPEPPRAKEQV